MFWLSSRFLFLAAIIHQTTPMNMTSMASHQYHAKPNQDQTVSLLVPPVDFSSVLPAVESSSDVPVTVVAAPNTSGVLELSDCSVPPPVDDDPEFEPVNVVFTPSTCPAVVS